MVATIARTFGNVNGLVTNLATFDRERACISITILVTKIEFYELRSHLGYTT